MYINVLRVTTNVTSDDKCDGIQTRFYHQDASVNNHPLWEFFPTIGNNDSMHPETFIVTRHAYCHAVTNWFTEC